LIDEEVAVLQSKDLERAIQYLKDLGFDTLPGDSATEMVKAFIEQRQKDESMPYDAACLRQDKILSALEVEKKEAYKTVQELKQRLADLIEISEKEMNSTSDPTEQAKWGRIIFESTLKLEKLEQQFQDPQFFEH
jgi:hypothetical protein